MTLTFCIFFVIGKLIKATLKRIENAKKIKLQNLRGGDEKFKLYDDNKLGFTIFSCIAENKNDLVKNPKIKNESWVVTPNMIRFFALKLLNDDQSLIVKILNTVVSSDNQVRLVFRVLRAIMIEFLRSIF